MWSRRLILIFKLWLCVNLLDICIAARFLLDVLNRQKNVLSKAIGEKMKVLSFKSSFEFLYGSLHFQKKEAQGTDENVADSIVSKLDSLKVEDLTVCNSPVSSSFFLPCAFGIFRFE